MFTGLVEETGIVRSLAPHPGDVDATDIVIEADLVAEDAKIGDSIANNGCCLTVVAVDGGLLTFQAGSETLARTNLGKLQPGDPVNLERSLQMGQRMGGHYVTGHVDGVATIDERNDEGEWSEFWFRVSESLTCQMASKGSVAVDGVSLTLVEVELQRQ